MASHGSSTSIRDHYLFDSFVRGTRVFFSDGVTAVSFLVFVLIILMGIFGPMLTPYQYDQRITNDDGIILRGESPSLAHPLGTTEPGYDVLSRILFGARSTLVTGFLGGIIIVAIGLTIGTTAGYVGGWVEEVLMRATDFVYSLPLIPVAILLVAYMGIGFWNTIFLIGALLWRGNARVFRSQVLQIKERAYVKSAEAMGASNRHIAFKHLLPNMGGMIVLFLAIGVGITILISASLSFLGMTNPFVPTWGVMLRNAYSSGYFSLQWWWSIPPGLMIGLTVLSTFMIGRGYERVQEAAETGSEF